MLKIYTKTGDSGETSLYGGKRVGKDSQRIKAYGDIDELNAILGLCISALDKRPESGTEKILKKIQHLLFVAGADLAAEISLKTVRITKKDTAALEKIIDKIEKSLPPLKNFIFPGGTKLSAHLHHARTVCRRAEREVIALSKKEKINLQLVPFLNRLSDLLFVMARQSNLESSPEEKFIAPKKFIKAKKT